MMNSDFALIIAPVFVADWKLKIKKNVLTSVPGSTTRICERKQ